MTIGKYYKLSPYMAMKEIFDNGPITAQFYMYRDLVDYKSGMLKLYVFVVVTFNNFFFLILKVYTSTTRSQMLISLLSIA